MTFLILREQKRWKEHVGQDGKHLFFIKWHIQPWWVLFTDFSVSLVRTSASLLVFSLAKITGNQPLKPALRENPPIMWRRSASKCTRRRLSCERFTAGGKATESYKWQINMSFCHSRSGARERILGGGERDSITVLVFVSSEFRLGYWISQKRFGLVWIKMLHMNDEVCNVKVNMFVLQEHVYVEVIS